MGEGEYLSVAEVARRYRVTAKTVRRWCARGYLPGAYRAIAGSGAPWRIPPAALRGFRMPKVGRPPAAEE